MKINLLRHLTPFRQHVLLLYFVTPTVGAKHELLFNEPATVQYSHTVLLHNNDANDFGHTFVLLKPTNRGEFVQNPSRT
jgi:hypothetical protein